MVVLESGATVEGSTVGNEGMDGLYLLADRLANPYKIIVQVDGEFMRISSHAFKQFMHDSIAMLQLLSRYALPERWICRLHPWMLPQAGLTTCEAAPPAMAIRDLATDRAPRIRRCRCQRSGLPRSTPA